VRGLQHGHAIWRMSIKCGDEERKVDSQTISTRMTLTFDLLHPKSVSDQGTSKSFCVPNMATLLSSVVRKQFIRSCCYILSASRLRMMVVTVVYRVLHWRDRSLHEAGRMTLFLYILSTLCMYPNVMYPV